ncbi:hypothetical protein FDUTEX481_03963 [Tolypothrix sp. PCC 7601]|nr:hypothetical protein FDUTEX481_03963 [Tolypothrix sp. PCC 7601]
MCFHNFQTFKTTKSISACTCHVTLSIFYQGFITFLVASTSRRKSTDHL